MHFVFPKPRDWNTFEDIVADVFAWKYQNMNLQRYGRSGQRQNGVDIAGLITGGVLGVQCKHHPLGDVSTSEIDSEIANSSKFTPSLSDFIVATSADRDTKSHSYMMNLTQSRRTAGEYSVAIKYWQDICDWLVEYPDLVYKHFTKFFPSRELEHVQLSAVAQQARQTISWPCTVEELIAGAEISVGDVKKIDPYQLSLGFTTFEGVSFRGKVDAEVLFSDLLSSSDSTQDTFLLANNLLKQIKSTITTPYFSNNLLLYAQTRLTFGLLLGWTFRKVANFRLSVVAGQEVWPSEGLILTSTSLYDDFPVIYNANNNEVALVLNISRNIRQSVDEFVASWDTPPKAVVGYRLEGGPITSAAHALSLAIDISQRIKNLIDKWSVRKVHLFAALPVALAVLIGHHLNAICPITIYYLDENRSAYLAGGTLTNSM